jgi:hypothetical protein
MMTFALVSASQFLHGQSHKVLIYVEYRAVSGVFQNIDPPPPLHPASVSSPRNEGVWGLHTRRAVRGGGGHYFGRRQT